MKKQSDLSRLMGYAGNYRYFTYASWVLSAVSALVALVPFVYIWKILRDVLNAAPDYAQAVNIPHYGWMAVRVCSIAGHSFCGDLLPHRQFVGDGIPARCHGYFVHAHRWAVRHHYRGRCGKRLRCIHAAFGAAVSDPHRSSAAQKEAAGGTAVLAPVRKKIKAGCKKYPCILHRVLVYCICYRGTGLGVCPLFGNAVSRRCSIGT